MSCELRFHGESYGWEAQFFERGEFLFSRGWTLLDDRVTGGASAMLAGTEGVAGRRVTPNSLSDDPGTIHFA
jgi:hypothetical protein